MAVGDYNLTRFPDDKNTSGFNRTLANKFNDFIHNLALIELPLLDRLYTWSNKRDSPTLARLDRAFVNMVFSFGFPNTNLSSRVGTTSDHIPLLVSIPTALPKTHLFQFENAWLKSPNFLPSILPAWSNCRTNAADAAGRLVARIKAVRHMAKLWVRKHRSPPSIYHNCTFIILMLDVFEEWRTLFAGEQCLWKVCQARLALFINQRAAYWKQRGKFRSLREGDTNTRFFQVRASTRARRNQIQRLEIEGTTLVSHGHKTTALMSYYTDILGRVVPTSWAFDLLSLYNNADRAQCDTLMSLFTEQQAKAAVKGMNAASVPRPDGIGPSFYAST